MAIVAGVDGCKNAWFCVAKDVETGRIWFGDLIKEIIGN